MAYMCLPTSASDYFPPLIYLRTSRLGCLFLHGEIFNLLESTSMLCNTFFRALTALSTVIALLFFLAMDRVTRHILKIWLLVTCRPILLDLFEVLSGAIWCDNMKNELWGESANVSLNIIFLCRVDFLFVGLRY